MEERIEDATGGRVESHSFTEADAAPASTLPSLPARLAFVFVSPANLMQQLAKEPKWIGALLVGAFVVGLSMALVPVDIILEAQRQAALDAGREMPELPQAALTLMRIVIPATSVIMTAVMSFVFAGVCTVVFAFILGDEGTYKQYLAVISHAWFIAVLFGLLITPLRISQGDVQLTLNLGSFLPFLPDGYFSNLFRLLDLTQIWASLVIAQGIHAIDRRRSFASAAMILLALLVGVSAIMANFI
jgi:hypothetical protein